MLLLLVLLSFSFHFHRQCIIAKRQPGPLLMCHSLTTIELRRSVNAPVNNKEPPKEDEEDPAVSIVFHAEPVRPTTRLSFVITLLGLDGFVSKETHFPSHMRDTRHGMVKGGSSRGTRGYG